MPDIFVGTLKPVRILLYIRIRGDYLLNRYRKIGGYLLCIGLFTVGPSSLSLAADLDFGWGSPIQLSEKPNSDQDQTYLAWPIQVRNSTQKRLAPHLEIVAVTDTGRQYTPNSRTTVRGPIRSVQVVNFSDFKSGIFPSVTRQTVVLFENVDPMASTIDFYVGGLVGTHPTGEKKRTYLRITYRRVLSGWIWEEISALN